MSKMGQLVFEVQELAHMGIPNDSIAKQLCIPIEMVDDIVQQFFEDENYDGYDDSMDGDHASALASAGFGTDEDYGYYGEEY